MGAHQSDPASWPLLARGALVADIVSGVTRRPGRSQLIRGPSGIGKTTVAAHVARTLSGRGLRVVPIVALAELSHVPLAALAPLLATAPTSENRVDLRLQSLVTLIGAAPHECVLVVDDAPLLDEVSASTLYQLIRVFGVAAVMTARDEHTISGPLERLHHENLLTLIDVPPLSAVEVEEVVERYLEKPLQPDIGATLQRYVEGNPLYLREIVFEAERSGRVLAKDFGVVIEPTSLPRYWLDTFRTRIDDIRPKARRLAQLLSVSQPWPVSLASSIGADALDELRRRAVVSIEPDERQLVRLAHPFFTEAIVGDMSATRRKQTVRRAAAALRSTDIDSDRLTAAHLLLEEPDTDARELEWAASFALDARDAAAALRLARAAKKRGGGFTTDFIFAIAASAVGDVTEAEEAFESSMSVAPSEEDRARVLLRWGQHEAYRMHRPDLAISRTTLHLPALSPTARDIVLPELIKWRLMAGEQAILGELKDGTQTDALSAVSHGLVRSMVATMAGHSADATAAISATRALLPPTLKDLPHASDLLDLSEFLVSVAEGRIVDAQAFAASHRASGPTDAAGMWTYTLALIHLHAGVYGKADELAELAVRQLEWRDFTGLVGCARALSATTAALLGDEDRARMRLTELPSASLKDAKTILQRGEALAWLDVSAGKREEAAQRIRAAVKQALLQQHELLAAITATVAIRIGLPNAVLDLLEESASENSAEIFRAVCHVARAASRSDHAVAVSMTPRLRAAGLDALALHICSVAAVRSPETMIRRKARLFCAELNEGALSDATLRRSPSGDARLLSRRELEIAHLAAQRIRSRHIAEQLGVSVRTVENHLGNIYRKLEVNGREELAALNINSF